MEHSFWTHDYASGVEALFSRLLQGIAESSQFAELVGSRAKIARTHAGEMARFAQRPPSSSPQRVPPSVQADSRRVNLPDPELPRLVSACSSEAVTEAVSYTRLADDLDAKVRLPLEIALAAHRKRLKELEVALQTQITGYHKRVTAAKKRRAIYYDKCRKNEDDASTIADTSATADSPERLEPVVSTLRGLKDIYIAGPTPRRHSSSRRPSAQSDSDSLSLKPQPGLVFDIAGLEYSKEELASLFDKILSGVAQGEYRVPLLGPYTHVSTGASIAAASRRHLRNDSIAYSEKFGQALVDQGFLRPVAQLSNRFNSTTSSHYQWQPSAFEIAEISGVGGSAVEEESVHSSGPGSSASSSVESAADVEPSGAFEATKEGELYLQAVLDLDLYRCSMEAEIESGFREAEGIELDRLTLTRRALADYARYVARPQELADMQKRLISGPRNFDPIKELDNFVGRNETGPLVPSVMVYRGFNNDQRCQTFGTDLEQSLFLVPLVLDYLGDLEEVPLEYWIEPQPLEEIYKLRAEMNTGRPFKAENLFKFFTPQVVVATLKQYLLELPESLVQFTVYDKFRAAYGDGTSAKDDDEIVAGLVLLPAPSRETLQRLTSFWAERYKNEDERAALAHYMALALMRPRAVSALTSLDKHPAMLIEDLLDRGQFLFDAVKTRLENRPARPTPSSRPRRHVSSPAIPQRPSVGDELLLTPTRIRSPDPRTPLAGSPTTPGSAGLKPLTLSPSYSRETAPPSRGLGISALPVAKIPHRSVSGLPTRSHTSSSPPASTGPPAEDA